MKLIFGADAIRPPLTGIGRYALELARRFASAEEISSLQYLVGHRLREQLPVYGAVDGRRVGPRALTPFVLQNEFAVELYRGLSSLAKRFVLRNSSACIFHGPNYYVPPHLGPCVTTFHDLSVFRFPECHPRERVRYMRKELPLAIRRSQAVVCDSHYTRDELIAEFGLASSMVTAIPLACGAEFHPRPAVETLPVLGRYALEPDCYTLFVGTVEPRKNLRTLLEAYGRLPLRLRLHYPLVVAGYEGWHSDDVHGRIIQAQAEGWARYLGYVASQDLPVLYSGARVFAFPSLYEGFGLPVLEAMASGVPVVCSNASSLPEVAGDAAAMHNPGDVPSLTEALHQALEDIVWRETAITAGVARAATFSWERTARETIAVYRKLI